MFADFVFYSTLAFSITFACYYKRIDDAVMKSNYGTGLGLIIALFICGAQIIGLALMVWGNIVIIKCGDRRYIHQISLCWTWLLLLYMHFYYVNQTYVIWLNQTIALRMVGLAFEIYGADMGNTRSSTVKIHSTGDTDLDFTEPTVHDIVSYTFFFIGIHKGPYFTWKVYKDQLTSSFGALGDCRIITEQKFKKMLLCLTGYVILRAKYSTQTFGEESFYTDYDMDARYIYNMPLLTMYFLKIQMIMLLATSACTEAGFGVYPSECNALPGLGPSTRLSLLKLVDSPEKALDMEYNFAMLKCFDADRLLIGPRMRDTMKGWDLTTRFWFWTYVYKSLLKADKAIRRACSCLAWTLYLGPSIQQLLISSTLWIYIQLEKEYSEFYETSSPSMPRIRKFGRKNLSKGANKIREVLESNQEVSVDDDEQHQILLMKVPWDIGFSIMRMFCLIYLTPCLMIEEIEVLFRYYNSIFWVYHIILLVMLVGAVIIHRNRRQRNNVL